MDHKLRLTSPDNRGLFTTVELERLDPTQSLDVHLHRWLSLYLGEDMGNPTATRDTRFHWMRGRMGLEFGHLTDFLTYAESYPPKGHPKWRKEGFEYALSYYHGAVRLGHLAFPAPISLFATCIELIANLHQGNRTQRAYKTLG